MIHSGEMKVEARRLGPVAVLTPDGSVTIGESAENFRVAIDAAIDGGARHVLVEGSRIRYIDSTGMGEMISALRRLMPAGGRVGIAAPSPKLRDILEITGLAAIFVVGEDEGAVLRKLSETKG
jgi:anti-sigma B factor antagonist